MKSIKEIYQALVDGKTLIHKNTKMLVTIKDPILHVLNNPNTWEIYEPQWKIKPDDPYHSEYYAQWKAHKNLVKTLWDNDKIEIIEKIDHKKDK